MEFSVSPTDHCPSLRTGYKEREKREREGEMSTVWLVSYHNSAYIAITVHSLSSCTGVLAIEYNIVGKFHWVQILVSFVATQKSKILNGHCPQLLL